MTNKSVCRRAAVGFDSFIKDNQIVFIAKEMILKSKHSSESSSFKHTCEKAHFSLLVCGFISQEIFLRPQRLFDEIV